MSINYREVRQGTTTDIIAVSLLPMLRETELVDSVDEPTVLRAPVDADELVFGTPAILTAEMEIGGVVTGEGQGFTVEVTLETDQALGRYHVQVPFSTDSTPPRGKVYCLTIEVVGC